jgi:hypothetical protein
VREQIYLGTSGLASDRGLRFQHVCRWAKGRHASGLVVKMQCACPAHKAIKVGLYRRGGRSKINNQVSFAGETAVDFC